VFTNFGNGCTIAHPNDQYGKVWNVNWRNGDDKFIVHAIWLFGLYGPAQPSPETTYPILFTYLRPNSIT